MAVHDNKFTEEDEDIINSLDGDEGLVLSPADIYEKLCLEEELLITILPEHFEALKKGVIQVKGKDNMRLKERGLLPNNATLEFDTVPSDTVEGAIQVHIALIKKAGIPIIAINTPEPF